MTERIKKAMQLCAADPAAGQPLLRSLLDEDRECFIGAAIPLLSSESDAPGFDALLKVVVATDELIRRLCDPALFTKESSIQLAQQAVKVEPLLDSRLARLLPRDATPGDPSSNATSERLLELLDVISSSPRIVGPLTHLMRSPNQRLRAKAALLIGRFVRNTTHSEKCLQTEADGRVRANSIEAQGGLKGDAVARLLSSAAQDSNNRVVGNALLGLYRLPDQSAIPKLLAMAADPRPPYRATAAWVMGQTADPRFVPVLEKLSHDLYASVRRNAAKSAALLPQREKVDGRVFMRTLRREETPDGACRLFIQAVGPGDEPVRKLDARHFVLWKDRELITAYSALEYSINKPLAIGLALSQDQGISAEILDLKRPEDQWAIAKLLPAGETARKNPPPEPPLLLFDAARLKASLAELPAATMHSLLTGVIRARGLRHLILLAPPDFDVSAEMAACVESAAGNKVAIHAITVGRTHPSVQNMCRRTQGILTGIAVASELREAYRQLYLALTHHYEIRFEAQAVVATRAEIYCEASYGHCELGSQV